MKNNNQMNIFIVEDNNVFTLALKADIETSFTKIPIQIHSFETGEACMKEFKKEQPKVVILDYHLNSKNPYAADGIKVLDWIKKENPETNVIMLTNDDSIDIALKSFHHGASDYVVKTDSQFRKINYSLFNLFKIMEAKNEARIYKNLFIAILLCLGIIIGVGITTRLFTSIF